MNLANCHMACYASQCPHPERCSTDVPSAGPSRLSEATRIARLFHLNYERLAPRFGYQTRRESAVSWDEVPQQNKDLMIATVEALIDCGAILVPGPG